MQRSPIVVCDDEPAFMELMREFLTEVGYSNVLTTSMSKVHDVVLQQQPVILLLDINVEQPKTGLNVLELLKLDPQTSHIPVLICSTGVRMIQTKIGQFAAKGCYWLEKPFLLEDALATLEAIIGADAKT